MNRDYRVFEVDLTTGDFSSPVFESRVESNKSIIVPDLEVNTQYKWRCKDVLDSGIETKWSELQYFTTTLRPDFILNDEYYLNYPDDIIATTSPYIYGHYQGVLMGGYYFHTTAKAESPYYTYVASYSMSGVDFSSELNKILLNDGTEYATYGFYITSVPAHTDHLFAWGNTAIFSINISDPSNLTITQALRSSDIDYDDSSYVRDICAVSNSAIALLFAGKIVTIDVTDPSNMSILDVCTTNVNGDDLNAAYSLKDICADIDTSRIYTSDWHGDINVFDTSNINTIVPIINKKFDSIEDIGTLAYDTVNKILYANSWTYNDGNGGVLVIDAFNDYMEIISTHNYTFSISNSESLNKSIIVGGSLFIATNDGNVITYYINNPKSLQFKSISNWGSSIGPYITVNDNKDVFAISYNNATSSVSMYKE